MQQNLEVIQFDSYNDVIYGSFSNSFQPHRKLLRYLESLGHVQEFSDSKTVFNFCLWLISLLQGLLYKRIDFFDNSRIKIKFISRILEFMLTFLNIHSQHICKILDSKSCCKTFN